MNVLAAIAADDIKGWANDIKAWQELAVVGVAAVGVAGAAFITMAFSLVYLVKSRLDALHGTQQTMQTALNLVQQAVPASQSADVVQAIKDQTAALATSAAPPVVKLDKKATAEDLAALVLPHLLAALAPAPTKPAGQAPAWPSPSQTLPGKTAQ